MYFDKLKILFLLSLLQPLLNAGVVTNTNDMGTGSLRAVLAAAMPGESITFNIMPYTGVQTITLMAGPLVFPLGVSGITIDGSTQPVPADFPAGTKHIVISSTVLFPGPYDGLDLQGNDNCIITELAINNCNNGISIKGSGNQVLNCYLGTDASGSMQVANVVGISAGPGDANRINNCVLSYSDTSGISLFEASNTIVNGCTMASNSFDGIYLDLSSDNSITNNVIQNNFYGIEIAAGSNANIIGQPGNGNTITGNNEGIVIDALPAPAPVYNRILYNSIFDNTTLGIDFGPTGIPASNQSMNPVLGTPNESQNYPVLSSAVINCDGTITVNYTLYSAAQGQSGIPLSPYTIQFFSNTTDRSTIDNITEGQTYIGQTTTIATDSKGNLPPLSYTFTPLASVSSSDVISATATSPTGDTSEFSYNVGVTQTACPVLQISKKCYKKKHNFIQFTITVSNIGTAVATNVTITDTLPKPLKFKSAFGAGYSVIDQTVTAVVPALIIGQSIDVVIYAKVCGCLNRQINNTVVVASNQTAPQTSSCLFCVN